MRIQNSNSSYRKWGVGLGVLAAAVLSGYLALKPTKKNIIPLSTQPAAKLLEPKQQKTLEKAVQLFEAVERAKLADFNSGIKPEPKEKPNKGLKQLMAEMNDDPFPASNVNGKSVETNEDGVCYEPYEFSKMLGDREYELIIGGKSFGYIYLRRASDPFDELKMNTSHGVFDAQGNLIGYRAIHSVIMGSNFLSRGLKGTDFFEDNLHEIHRPIDSATYLSIMNRPGDEKAFDDLDKPIGKVDEITGEIKDVDGEVLGKTDKQYFYVPIMSTPRCEEPMGGKTITFLKFNSESEFERFLSEIKRSIGSNWEKLVKKPQVEENNQEED